PQEFWQRCRTRALHWFKRDWFERDWFGRDRREEARARRALRPFPQHGTRHGEGPPERCGHAEREQGDVHRQKWAGNGGRVAGASREQSTAPSGRPEGSA